MATHSSILAWKIPWAEDPWGRIEADMTATNTQITQEEPGGRDK